jgi:hypothetical protein
MTIHSQNLGDEKASKFWYGRACLKKSAPHYDDTARIEWGFFKHAGSFSIYLSTGGGDSDADVCFHIAIPFIFSIFITIANVRRCKNERKTGVSIHSEAIWVHLFDKVMESNSSDPWYGKSHCWNFPWQLDWRSTEILQHKAKEVAEMENPVWIEAKKDRHKSWSLGFPKALQARQDAEIKASEDYDYTYVHVVRMIWKARWWPLIPRMKSRTSIDIRFDQEVGERTGSWKGGCTGCGWDMLQCETPLEALRRMERERKF